MYGLEGQSDGYIDNCGPGDQPTGRPTHPESSGPGDQPTGRPTHPESSETGPENPTTLPQTAPAHTLTNRLGQYFARGSRPEIIDPNFSRRSRRYLFQSVLGTLAILAVLLFVDSLSQAAIVAALGSSVVILFLHPTSHTASPRALIGGHGLALLLGSAFAALLFAAPVETFLENLSPVRDLSLAISVGLLILGMAITNTEHPPAAGTVLGIATRPWDLQTFGIIIGAVLLLAAIQRLLRSHLRDLN